MREELQIINISKLYRISVQLNFIPIIVTYLRLDGDFFGVLFSLILFIIASLINLSFYLLKIQSVRKSKIMSFFACYTSSLFFLVLVVSAMYNFANFGKADWRNYLDIFLFFGIHFIINFLLIFIYKKIIKFKQNNTQDKFIEN